MVQLPGFCPASASAILSKQRMRILRRWGHHKSKISQRNRPYCRGVEGEGGRRARRGAAPPRAARRVSFLGPPQIENLAEEPPVLPGRDGVGQRRSVGRELRQGNELQVIDAQAPIELVQLARLLHVGLAEDAQNIEIHFLRLEQFDAVDDALPGAALLLIETEAVVDLLGPIERYPEQPLILAEQVAPVLVEQDGVGLQRIADRLARAAVLLLEGHQFFEKRQSGEGRFAALKREHAVGVRVEQVGIHQALERLQRHAAAGQRTVRVGLAIQVEAILAIQIAHRGGRLDEQRRDPRYRTALDTVLNQALTENRQL